MECKATVFSSLPSNVRVPHSPSLRVPQARRAKSYRHGATAALTVGNAGSPEADCPLASRPPASSSSAIPATIIPMTG